MNSSTTNKSICFSNAMDYLSKQLRGHCYKEMRDLVKKLELGKITLEPKDYIHVCFDWHFVGFEYSEFGDTLLWYFRRLEGADDNGKVLWGKEIRKVGDEKGVDMANLLNLILKMKWNESQRYCETEEEKCRARVKAWEGCRDVTKGSLAKSLKLFDKRRCENNFLGGYIMSSLEEEAYILKQRLSNIENLMEEQRKREQKRKEDTK